MIAFTDILRVASIFLVCGQLGNLLVTCHAQESSPDKDTAKRAETNILQLSLKNVAPRGLTLAKQQHNFPGQPIIIEATIEIYSSHRLAALTNFSPRSSIRFNVIQKEGDKEEQVPRTRFGEKLPAPSAEGTGLSGKGPVVKPEKPITLRYNLARRFDLTEPGEYEVTAYMISEIFSDNSSGVIGKIEAEPITIVITEGNPSDQELTY